MSETETERQRDRERQRETFSAGDHRRAVAPLPLMLNSALGVALRDHRIMLPVGPCTFQHRPLPPELQTGSGVAGDPVSETDRERETETDR